MQALIYAISELKQELETETTRLSSESTSFRSKSQYNPFLRTMKTIVSGLRTLWETFSETEKEDISGFLDKIKNSYDLSTDYDLLLKYILCYLISYWLCIL